MKKLLDGRLYKTAIICWFLTAWLYPGISPIADASRICCADFNNDGLLDIAHGRLGYIDIYFNQGTASSPLYPAPGTTITFPSTTVGISVTAGDIDVDGDFDLLGATTLGSLIYCRNDGTPSSPSWTIINDGVGANTFAGITYGNSIYGIALVDLNGDGDLDLTFNDYQSVMVYYMNQDKEADGWVDGSGVSWVLETRNKPFNILPAYYPRVSWADMEGDGDFDAICGGNAITLGYMRNNGTPTAYGPFTSTSPNFNTALGGTFQTIAFDDFNGDGFLDLFYIYNESKSIWREALISAITRSNQPDTDNRGPIVPVNALTILTQLQNSLTLKWPMILDSSSSSYRSGIKKYSLYRSTEGPVDIPPASTDLIWEFSQTQHYPHYMKERANGDKWTVDGGYFKYFDSALQGGEYYYYLLEVTDHAGNKSYSDPVNGYIAPPILNTVNVTMTPAAFNQTGTLRFTAVDQYGMPFLIQNAAGGAPNVQFQVYENGSQTPSGIDLQVYPAGGGSPVALATDTVTNLSTKSYVVSYRPDQDCTKFTVKITITHYKTPTETVVVSAASSTVTIDRVRPGLPGSLMVDQDETTASSLKLVWAAVTDNCSGIAGYRVRYRKAGITVFTVAGTTTGLFFTQNNLNRDTVYYFYVTAYDAAGNETLVTEPSSVEVSGRTALDNTPPSAPANVTATFITNNEQVKIEWSHSEDYESGVKYYEIEKSLDGTTFGFLVRVNFPDAKYTEDYAYNQRAVFYRVKAINNLGLVSAWSNIAKADISDDLVPPTVPTNVALNALTSNSIRITWNGSTDQGTGVKSYRIYRNNAANSIAEVTSTSYTDTNLLAETIYTYRVSARDNANNESAKSSSASVKTPADPNKPNPPENLRATTIGSTTLTLAWDEPVANQATISMYKVYLRESALVNSDQFELGTPSGRSFIVNELNPSTTYYFSVTAISTTSLESVHSAIVQVVTRRPPPDPPANFRVTGAGSNWVDLAWNRVIPVPGATIENYHLVFAKPVLNGYSYTLIVDTTALTYRVTGLTPQTLYRFAVRAEDSAGLNSSYTTPVSVTTLAPDITAPPVPGGLAGLSPTPTSITISWNAVTDETGGSGLAGYEVYQNGVYLVDTTATAYTITGLLQKTVYQYAVCSKDNAGNKSALTAAVEVRTGCADMVAPPAPAALSALVVDPFTISLGWSQVMDNNGGSGIFEYEIYRNGVFLSSTIFTTYSDEELLPLTTYTYYVLAVDNCGNKSAQSPTASAKTTSPDKTPPPVPGGLAGQSPDPATINLTWTAVTDEAGGSGLAGYEVYRNGIYLTGTTVPAFTDSELEPSTTYNYAVLALDNAGNKSVLSPAVAVQTGSYDTVAPPAPGNLTAQVVDPNTVSLGWPQVQDNEGGSGMAGYEVYRNGVFLQATLFTNYSDEGLQPLTTYTYYVKAVDNAGNKSAPSAEATAKTTSPDKVAPPVPAGLSGAAEGPTVVKLEWTAVQDEDGGSGLAGYLIRRSGQIITPLPLPGVTFNDTGLMPYTDYSYQVAAIDLAGNTSAFSEAVSVRTPSDDQTPPQAPANLKATPVDAHTVSLLWDQVQDNENGTGFQGYEVFRNDQLVLMTVFNSYTDENLDPMTEYTYKVRAVDNVENRSGFCEPVVVSTPSADTTPPPAPENLTGEAVDESSVSLSWNAVQDEEGGSGLAGYLVFRGGVQVTPSPLVATAFIDTGLTPYTEYTYQVKAIDQGQNMSSNSAPLVLKTKDLTPPPAPLNLAGTVKDQTDVELSWDPVEDMPGGSGFDRYFIYRNGVKIGEPAAPPYLDESLPGLTEFHYTVTAVDKEGNESAASNEIAVTTEQGDHTPPPPPNGIRALPEGPEVLNLSWDPVHDGEGGTGVASYEIYRDSALIGTSTAPSYHDTGLTPLTVYQYQILAIDGAGNRSEISPLWPALTSGEEPDLLCAHVASTELWQTRFNLANIGALDSPVYISAINANGYLLETVKLESMPPSTILELDAASLFTPSTLSQDMWVRISTNAELKGVLVFGTRDEETLVTIPMFTGGAPDLIFPFVVANSMYFTGVTLINVAAEAIAFDLEAYTEAGQLLDRITVNLPLGGKYVRLVDQIFNVENPGRIRLLMVKSDKPLIGFELFGNFFEKGLAGLPAFSPSTNLFRTAFKQAAPGHGKTTVLPSTPTGFKAYPISSSQVYLAWNSNPETDIKHYEVLSNDSVFPSLIGKTSSNNYIVSQLLPERTYHFSLRAINNNDEESEATVELAVKTLKEGEHYFPHQVYYNEIPDNLFYFTGLTFSNLGAQPTKVFGELFNAQGQLIAEFANPVNLNVMQQKTTNVEAFFNNTLPPGAAYLRVGSVEKLLGFELFFTRQASEDPYQFDGIIGLETGAKVLYFPLIRSGNGWDSFIRVTDVSGATNQLSVYAFNSLGQPAGVYYYNLPAKGQMWASLQDLFPETATEITWVYVEATAEIIGNLRYVSRDFKQMSSYVGLAGKE